MNRNIMTKFAILLVYFNFNLFVTVYRVLQKFTLETSNCLLKDDIKVDHFVVGECVSHVTQDRDIRPAFLSTLM